MSAKVRMQIGKVWLETDSMSAKDAISALSEYAEVFSQTTCGECQSDNVRPSHRQAQGYDFYEMLCLACGARLQFGQRRDGGCLFPKRKDTDGNWLPNGGWSKYQPKQTNHDDAAEFF